MPNQKNLPILRIFLGITPARFEYHTEIPTAPIAPIWQSEINRSTPLSEQEIIEMIEPILEADVHADAVGFLEERRHSDSLKRTTHVRVVLPAYNEANR